MDIPEELIDGTIHCRENAAQLLIETLYQTLTNRKYAPMFSSQVVFTYQLLIHG